jgi:hypothetical protein
MGAPDQGLNVDQLRKHTGDNVSKFGSREYWISHKSTSSPRRHSSIARLLETSLSSGRNHGGQSGYYTKGASLAAIVSICVLRSLAGPRVPVRDHDDLRIIFLAAHVDHEAPVGSDVKRPARLRHKFRTAAE